MIEIKNLSYMYNKNDIILKNINIKINNGEIVSIIGKNGKNAIALRTIIQAYAYVKGMKKVKINIDAF